LSCRDFALVVERQISVAALRYFEVAAVAGLVRELTDASLPGPGQALRCVPPAAAVPQVSAPPVGVPPVAVPPVAVPPCILAWRSPTETLVLTPDTAALATLGARLAGATDACLVDQSGGIWVLRLTGARVADVLVRLGATTAIPGLGQARTSRLAELTVTALCVQEQEILLLVDRLYADHLLGWIRETIADF
jgi:sarcosine oxidase gamma subunit